MAEKIKKSDLQVGDVLKFKEVQQQDNAPVIWPGSPEGYAIVKVLKPQGVGVFIPGWNGQFPTAIAGYFQGYQGWNLEGLLTGDEDRSGYFFTVHKDSYSGTPGINDLFERASAGMIPQTTKIDFDSVILADHKKEQIIHALKQIDFNDLIFTTWGFSKTFEKGRGVSMLFYGPPGTGKTLMAQAIAHHLDYSLKIISTADIQSSVPGEAERNIRTHFKNSKDGKVVLLFDECDSLIYSREGVGAILGAQINELLSQLERFDGVTIFTTNRLGTLDEAVNRRLSIKVEFAMPTVDERIDIWKRMFPVEAPLSKDIDWRKLAKYEVAGGHIKNSVLRAARMAATEDIEDHKKQISMVYLLKAVKLEVAATKEFHRAKAHWEGRHYGSADGLSHEEGSINSLRVNELAKVRKSIKEMSNESASSES